MKQSAHGIIWRWLHRHEEPPSTDQEWTSFRVEQRRKQRTGEAIVELLQAPANIKALQARRVPTPGPEVLTFEDWQRTRTGAHGPLTPLPPTPHDTGSIQPVAQRQHYTLLPDRFRSSGLPRMDPEVRHEVFAQMRTVPSKPLEHGPVPVQNTGEIVKEDHFLAIGPDALFEPMDKVPTARQLTEAERAAMVDATDSMFELPAHPGSNTWEEFEALASKSGLLPVIEQWRMEMPTAEVPALHTREQTERAAARRARYQLPDVEQRESE